MADFDVVVKITLQNEGGYVDNPNDPGGATNMGIEQQDLPDIDIKTLTVDQATAYYAEHYWKPYYGSIESQATANKLFDMGVLFGVGTAVGLLQRALGVSPDGVFGPETLQAVNEHPSSLLGAYKAQLVNHVQLVVSAKPETREFMNGWIRRINS